MVRLYSTPASALLCLTAVTKGLARPLEGGDPFSIGSFDEPSNSSILERRLTPGLKSWDLSNMEESCAHTLDDSNPNVREDIWFQSTSGLYLDLFVRDRGRPDEPPSSRYKNWVRRLDMSAWEMSEGKRKKDSNWDCASLSSICGPVPDCRKLIYIRKTFILDC